LCKILGASPQSAQKVEGKKEAVVRNDLESIGKVIGKEGGCKPGSYRCKESVEVLFCLETIPWKEIGKIDVERVATEMAGNDPMTEGRGHRTPAGGADKGPRFHRPLPPG